MVDKTILSSIRLTHRISDEVAHDLLDPIHVYLHDGILLGSISKSRALLDIEIS